MEKESLEITRIEQSTYQPMAWLTFDPYLRFRTGNPEACNLRDPLTSFGLPTNLPGFEKFERNRQTLDDVVGCLQDAALTGIWVDDESLMYIDKNFARYLLCQNRHLVVYQSRDHARRLRERVGLEAIEGELCEESWR